jgi:hypothetical protein
LPMGRSAEHHRCCMQFVAIQSGVLPLPDYVPVGVDVRCPRCTACFALCAKSGQWSCARDSGCKFASVACAKLRCDLALACCGNADGHCLLEFTQVLPKEAVPPTQ